MLHDLQGLGSLTTIWGHLSDTWDNVTSARAFAEDRLLIYLSSPLLSKTVAILLNAFYIILLLLLLRKLDGATRFKEIALIII
jgi:hypothetical protein